MLLLGRFYSVSYFRCLTMSETLNLVNDGKKTIALTGYSFVGKLRLLEIDIPSYMNVLSFCYYFS